MCTTLAGTFTLCVPPGSSRRVKVPVNGLARRHWLWTDRPDVISIKREVVDGLEGDPRIPFQLTMPPETTEPMTARVFLSPVPRARARALGDGSKTAVIRFTLLCEAAPPAVEPPAAAQPAAEPPAAEPLAAASTALARSDRATQVELSVAEPPVTTTAPPGAELPPPPDATADDDMPAPPPPLPLPRSSREGFSTALRRYEARRAHAAALARLESAIDGFSRDAHTMLSHRAETDEAFACDTLGDGAEMDDGAAFGDARGSAGSTHSPREDEDEDEDQFEGSDYEEEEEEEEEEPMYADDELAEGEGEAAACRASGGEREEEEKEEPKASAGGTPAEDEMSGVTDVSSLLDGRELARVLLKPVIDAPDLMTAIVKTARLALDDERFEAEQPHVVHFDATMPALEPAVFLTPQRVAFVDGIASSLRVALADVSLGAARAGSLIVPVVVQTRSLVAAEELVVKIASADELVPREQFGVCTVGSARVSLAADDCASQGVSATASGTLSGGGAVD